MTHPAAVRGSVARSTSSRCRRRASRTCARLGCRAHPGGTSEPAGAARAVAAYGMACQAVLIGSDIHEPPYGSAPTKNGSAGFGIGRASWRGLRHGLRRCCPPRQARNRTAALHPSPRPHRKPRRVAPGHGRPPRPKTAGPEHSLDGMRGGGSWISCPLARLDRNRKWMRGVLPHAALTLLRN